jgi:hypothetical protein
MNELAKIVANDKMIRTLVLKSTCLECLFEQNANLEP